MSLWMSSQAAYSASQVARPATPSTVSPMRCWNTSTARRVAAPKRPSTVTSGWAASNCARPDSQNCSTSTSAPSLPSRRTTPGHAPSPVWPLSSSPSLVSWASSLTLT